MDNLESAISFDPGSAALHLELGRLHWHLRDHRRALHEGEEAARLAPDSLEVHRFLATVRTALIHGGDEQDPSLERAIFHHERAMALAPEGEESREQLPLGQLYQHAGRFDDAERILTAYIKTHPQSATAYYWLSQAYIGQGHLDKASLPLRQALHLSPRSARYLEALVDLYERRGDLPAAIKLLGDLISLTPTNLAPYTRLAQLHQRSGRPLEAISVYERAEKIAGEKEDGERRAAMAEIHLGWAEALMDSGRVEEALERVALGSEEFPDDLRFPLAEGQLLYRGGDAEAGIRTLEDLLRENPGNGQLQVAISDVFLGLGAREERAGRITESIDLLGRSIRVNPGNDRALNYLGYLWAEQGENLEKSIEYIRRALEIGGENGAYLDSLGWAYFQSGRYDLAEPPLEKAASLSGDEPVILEHLGDLYRATGRAREAADAWGRALEAGAENPEVLQQKIDSLQLGEEPER